MRAPGYARPDTLDELLDVLAEEGPEARIVAGGTDLWVKVRLGRPLQTLVNVSRVPELTRLAFEDGTLHVGATVTVAQLLRSAEVLRHASLLWQSADHFASPLVRSRATVGGNLANASPAADLVLALIALDAEVDLASSRGRRSVPAETFATGPGRSVLEAGEVIAGVRMPSAQGRYQRFEKGGTRPAMSIALASVAVALGVEGGVARRPRVAFGAVAPVALRGRATEAALDGRPLDETTIAAAVRAALGEVRPIDDVRGTAVYRRRLVAAHLRRCLERAAAPSEARLAHAS